MAAAVCALAGFCVFQFFGNATFGYIRTHSVFYWWVYQWVNPESETEHAWLILALSLFLLWRNLRRRTGADGQAVGVAIAATLFGLALHVLGFVAQQPRISILALLVFTWGVLLLGGGRRWGNASAFPLGLMVFAVPVNALDTVGFWLQMWVVGTGERLAHLVGIAVIRNGTQLFAPDGRYQYDVVAACSGVRSLMALTALSLVIGYLWFRPFWLRALIVLISFPMVFAGNVVRITAIVIAAQWGGQSWGDRVHDAMGFGVFLIVLGGVLAAADLIARIRPSWTRDQPGLPEESPSSSTFSALPAAAAVVAASIAAAAFLFYRSSLPINSRSGVVLSTDGMNPVELPTYVGTNWMGHRVEPDSIERAILPPDTGFSRKLYVNLEEPKTQVLLSIVLSGRDRSSIHRPELCLVGQGWTIDSTTLRRFSYPGSGHGGFLATVLRVHRRVAGPKGGQSVPEVVVYWFVGEDRVFATQAGRMLNDAWSRVTRGRAPRWAYVFLKTGAQDGAERGLEQIQSILDSALPAFQPPIPGGSG
jgi:exosortase